MNAHAGRVHDGTRQNRVLFSCFLAMIQIGQKEVFHPEYEGLANVRAEWLQTNIDLPGSRNGLHASANANLRMSLRTAHASCWLAKQNRTPLQTLPNINFTLPSSQ